MKQLEKDESEIKKLAERVSQMKEDSVERMLLEMQLDSKKESVKLER